MAPDRSGAREESSELARRRQSSSKTETASGGESPAHPVLRLQRQVGNAQVSRMLAQRQAATIQREVAEQDEQQLSLMRVASVQRTAEEDEETKGDTIEMMRNTDIQRVTTDEDKEGAVELMRNTDIQRTTEEDEETKGDTIEMMRNTDIQRVAADDEDIELMRTTDIQRTASAAPEVGLEGGRISDDLAGAISKTAGTGSKMPDDMVNELQPHYANVNLKHVDVVQGNGTDQFHDKLQSQAFATGSSVFLSRDVPVSKNHTFLHELAHLNDPGQTSASGGTTVTPANSPSETYADEKAAQVKSQIG